MHDIFENIATITIGNTNRIPKTAIAMPQVKKRMRHLWDIFSSFVAFMTALSNDRLTSRAVITRAVNIKLHPSPAPTHSPR